MEAENNSSAVAAVTYMEKMAYCHLEGAAYAIRIRNPCQPVKKFISSILLLVIAQLNIAVY
jgi:hypothetical protein